MIKMNLKVVMLDSKDVKSADLNSNTMSQVEFDKMKDDIHTHGFTDPIKVRKNGVGYIVVDGHHRKKALEELGETKLPCIILADDSKQSKLHSIHYNTTRGTQNRRVMAQIIKQLQDEGMSLSDIKANLVFDEPELMDALDLLNLPENLEDYLKKMAEEEEKIMPKIYTFVVPAEHSKFVDNALDKVNERGGLGLAAICERYCEGNLSGGEKL